MVADIQRMVEARRAKHLETFVVVMSGPEAKASIQQMTAAQKITIPVTFLPAGPKAPDVQEYKISPAARNTVLLWRGGTVRFNFVNVDRATLPSVEKAVDDMLQ